MTDTFRPALADEPAAPKKPPNDVEIDALVHDCLEEDGYRLRVIVRSALARWGNPAPAPPADGEVAELVAWLEEDADDYACILNTAAAARCNRAAELLQRQVLVPVAVSERLPESKDCDEDGFCWWWEPIENQIQIEGWKGIWRFSNDHKRYLWMSPRTHWIPAHALPLPEVGE